MSGAARSDGIAEEPERAFEGADVSGVDGVLDSVPLGVEDGAGLALVEGCAMVARDEREGVAIIEADVAVEVGLAREAHAQGFDGGAEGGLVERLGVDEDAVEIEDDPGGGRMLVRNHGATVVRARGADTLRAMALALFYDDGLETLAPLTDLRASFDVRTGAMTTLERWRDALGLVRIALTVPPPLADITRERHRDALVNAQEALPDEPFLLINGRCVVPPPEVASLQVGEVIEDASGDPLVALVDGSRARALLTGRTADLRTRPTGAPPLMLTRPWSVRSHRDAALSFDLGRCARRLVPLTPGPGVTVIGAQGVHAAATARVMPGVIFDASQGVIALDEAALVRPGAIVIGPCFVGAHSTVLERATIRPGTAIGPWCKVNGEVGGTIFQGYANKAHDGYLGDSFVGEWVNLGAGTTNSNLLNTYGEVVAVARPGGSYERTGETFLGATIGDHCKTAICTRIMTGSVLHTGSMFATTAPVSGCVPAFTWATDAGARPYRLDKFLEVLRAAMARRTIDPSPAYLKRVAELASLGQRA